MKTKTVLCSRVLALILSVLVFCAGLLSYNVAAETEYLESVQQQQDTWDNEVFFESEKEVEENFSAYFASEQNARREDELNFSWKVEGGAICRTNNVDVSKDTVNIAVLTYKRDTYSDFEISVDFQAGAKTAYWPVVAIRQQIPGKYFLTPGGGAGIFMQQNGKITAWGPIVNAGAAPVEKDISGISDYYACMWHNLRIVAEGSSVTVYVDGVQELSLSVGTTDYIKGYISLLSVNNDCKFDNFKIRSLGSVDADGNEPNKSEWADDGTPLDDFISI